MVNYSKYSRLMLDANLLAQMIVCTDKSLSSLYIFFEDFYYRHDGRGKLKEFINKYNQLHSTGNLSTIDRDDNTVRVYILWPDQYEIDDDTVFETDLADFNRIIDEWHALHTCNPRPYEILMYRDELHDGKLVLEGIYELRTDKDTN